MTALASPHPVDLDRSLQFGPHGYPFIVRSGGGAWDDLAARLDALGADRFVLVADKGVPSEVKRLTRECLRRAAPVTEAEVTGGERGKTLYAVADLMERVLSSDVTRRTVVVSLGGGLVGNVAGLLAYLLLRDDVRLVHVPTTLLAIADSTPSLKNAVNAGGRKNIAGGFKKPALVWANTDVLRYLPPDEIRAALGEAIKNVVAIVPGQAGALRDVLRPTADYSPEELAWVISMCLDAKQAVMIDDPYEKSAALACEYGHTAGHVIELLCGYAHGLAIGVGGLVAARVAAALGILDASAEAMHEDLLLRSGAPVTVPGMPEEKLLAMLRGDNKRGYLPARRGHVDMVLLEEPGMLHYPVGEDKPITQVPEAIVLEAVRGRVLAA